MKKIMQLLILILLILSCNNTDELKNSDTILKKDRIKNSINKVAQDTVTISMQDSSKLSFIKPEMHDIDEIYSITCYFEKPLNKVDSLIQKLLNWTMADSVTIANDVEILAATKSSKAYCFLYICSCQPFTIKHVTPFQSFIGFIIKYGKPLEALNKNYWHIPYNPYLKPKEFSEQFYKIRSKSIPECYYIKK